MTAPEDVYIAAATASVRTEGVNDGYIASTARDEPFRAAIGVAYAAGRAAAAADIRAALAEDEADSDVSSGEAIWEQAGYRNGLAAAADVAEEPA